MDVTFHTDAAAFLADASPLLAADPVRGSVVAVMAERLRDAAPVDWPRWFATIRDGGKLVAAAMRTHPAPPHAGFALTMPADAADALAAALTQRQEWVAAWNGDLPTARRLLAAQHGEDRIEVAMHTRLFELTEVVWPARPEGALRQATRDDLPLVVDWVAAFHRDADAQGGRPVTEPDVDPEDLGRRLEQAVYWLWEVDGEPVHLTGLQPAAFGVRRIGPVFTPSAHRGHGYAAWVVATLSQRTLDEGHRVCLYTDQANPVSNKVYERIGYRALGDEGNLVLRPVVHPCGGVLYPTIP